VVSELCRLLFTVPGKLIYPRTNTRYFLKDVTRLGRKCIARQEKTETVVRQIKRRLFEYANTPVVCCICQLLLISLRHSCDEQCVGSGRGRTCIARILSTVYKIPGYACGSTSTIAVFCRNGLGIMPLTATLIMISFSSPTLFYSRLKTFFFANPSHCSLSFSSSALTT